MTINGKRCKLGAKTDICFECGRPDFLSISAATSGGFFFGKYELECSLCSMAKKTGKTGRQLIKEASEKQEAA